MIVTRSSMDQVWTDLSSPTKEEVNSLILSQNLDIDIASDLLSPTPKQYAKKFGKAVYMVMHVPHFKHAHSETAEQEIDFVITPNNLITTRYDSIDAMHNFAKKIEVSQILSKEAPTHLFFGLMKEIYSYLFDEIDYMRDWIQEIEKNIFGGREREMVFGISKAGRNILTFKRIILPHENIWETLMEIGKDDLGDKFEKELSMLSDEWERLMYEIKNISDMLDELRETNNAILTTKQNEIMKTFTILAFVTFPLSVIAAIFGMNTNNNPIVGSQYDFWIVVGFMLCVSLAMYSYFKYKKWI